MKIWVAGHNGMVGQALLRKLQKQDCHILAIDKKKLDLRQQSAVFEFVKNEKPDCIFITAAKVGGIQANIAQPLDFLYDNIMVAFNILQAAHMYNVKKVITLGASCMYSTNSAQPFREETILTGPLEKTNEGYAIAKIATIKCAEFFSKQYGHNFISAISTASYGVADNLDIESNHVIPGLIHRLYEAKKNGIDEFFMWGSGEIYREFIYVDDLSDALFFLMENYNEEQPINIGTGEEISIKDLTYKIAEIVGYKGKIMCDLTKPDGVKRKLLSSDKILKLGWKPKVSLDNGLLKTYQDFLERV